MSFNEETLWIGLFYLFCLINCLSTTIYKYFHVNQMIACRDGKTYPINSFHYSFRNEASLLVMNSTLEVTEDIQGPLKHSVILHRCTMDYSSCEYFNELVQDDICPSFDEPTFMGAFLETNEKKLKCPVKIGTYRFTNIKWNFSRILTAPAENYRWNTKTIIEQVKNQRIVYCVAGKVRFNRSRSRKVL
ncbi:uncharacterized protein LOC131681861 [Topomyia yanbarensis]|uniref:uncharacterized protein LOC131681861 n=1 Tax=Topomyia yanbarensis TaxID=2498891 RepID=UPI00273BE5E7|nr:uncharacterized protein LOC131681861 [Topomyia yanbarensis]